MDEALQTELDAERDARLLEAAQEERGYMLRFVLVALVFTVASWVYTAQSASRINTSSVAQLDHFDDLEFEEKSTVLNVAFKDLSVPSFYGGPRIPDSLRPDGEVYLRAMSEEDLITLFIAEDAFNLVSQQEASKIPPEQLQAERTRRQVLYSKVRRKKLNLKDVDASKDHAPIFSNYLSLTLRGYPIHSVSEREIKLCQSYAPCLAGALGRRHPSHLGTLKVLFQYANNRPFTRKSEQFMSRRLGYFIRARQILVERGIAPISSKSITQLNSQTTTTGTDVEVLKLLRLHHWEALHRSQMMSVFLSVITGLLSLLFWRNRRLT